MPSPSGPRPSGRKTIVALGGTGIGIGVVDATCEVSVSDGFPVEILTPPHAEAAMR